MLKGFKDFIMRGNVIELATAVIIGSAFTAIVKSITDSIIQPIINSLGSAEVGAVGFQITEAKTPLWTSAPSSPRRSTSSLSPQ